MLHTTKLVTLAILSMALNACSGIPNLNSQSIKLCADDQGSFSGCDTIKAENTLSGSNTKLATTNLQLNILSEYTEQMAADLRNDVRGMQLTPPLVVASFVNLDSSLQNTNTLGTQIAESFINQLQQMGLPVSEHRISAKLNINEQGDFAFSRNPDQIAPQLNTGHVLTGTMIKNNQGVLVNARIINLESNTVVASASKFVPNIVITNLL